MPKKKATAAPSKRKSPGEELRAAVLKHVQIEARDLDDATCEDIAQDALIEALANQPKKPLAYAKKVATNKIRDAWRARGRRAEAVEDERQVGSAEDAAIAYEDAGDEGGREVILAECRRRFRRATGREWTDELAAEMREALGPKPSIEKQARNIFDDLRNVLRRADRFIASHGREVNSHLLASVDAWCARRDAIARAELEKRRAEERATLFYEDLEESRKLGFVMTRDYIAKLAKGYGVTLVPSFDVADPELVNDTAPEIPEIATVEEPREWGPATDFLRGFMLRLGPLPDAIGGSANPWPPVADDVRAKLVERLSEGWAPLGGEPMRPADIAPVVILMGAAEWQPLLTKTPAMAIRHEANLIDGMCKRRTGKLTTVLQVDPDRLAAKAVQVPIAAPAKSVRAEIDFGRGQFEGVENDKGACTTHGAARRTPRARRA